MGIVSAAKSVAKAVTSAVKSAVSGGSSSSSKSSSSNKSSSSSSSSNKSSSSSSSSNTGARMSTSTANRSVSTPSSSSSKSTGGSTSSSAPKSTGGSSSKSSGSSSSKSSGSSSTSYSGSAKAGGGSVASFSPAPATTSSSKSSGSSSSKSSGSSSSKSSGGSYSSTTPVASTASGTRLANGTVVPASYSTSSGGSSSSKSSGGSSSSKSSGSSSSKTKVTATIPGGVATNMDGSTRLANGASISNPIASVGSSNYLNTFTNNVRGALSSSSSTGSSGGSSSSKSSSSKTNVAATIPGGVATAMNGGTRLANGQVIGGMSMAGSSGTSGGSSSSKTSTSKSSSSSSKPYAVASTTNGVLMSDGTIVPNSSTTKSGTNKTTTNTYSSSTKFDYKKQNANGSPAVSEGIDGTIRYADGSVYDPKTGVTKTADNKIVRDSAQATQVTEGEVRREANTRTNYASPLNSSSYNNITGKKNSTSTTDRGNQSALSVVLNSQGSDLSTSAAAPVGLQSKSLDTGGNRSIASQEGFNDNGDGSYTYIAPNGKQYSIVKDDNGNLAYQSSIDGEYYNVTDGDGKVSNDVNTFISFIRDQNQSDGINRSNVDNKDAVKAAGAQIEGTYVAPSGKEYDILKGTGENAGKVGFININGEAQWFDNQAAALDYIDARNPVGSKDLAKNTPLPTLADRGSYDGEYPETGIEPIDEVNEWNQEEWDERDQEIADLRDEIIDLRDQLENSSDEIDREKANIISSWLTSVDDFTQQMNDAVADLQEKSKLLEDNERMRWARQRAAQLAAQGYLTSEQVSQVANYSLTDYNKELEANALEAAKAIAELKIQLGQKRQDYINAIMSQQTVNAENKQAQINYINDWYTKYLDSIDSKVASADQFYHGLISSNLAMNIQNELGYDSIVRQNDAQNIVNDRNQQKAFTDTEYRRQYILNNISDANLHAYANQAINYLINNGNFIFPGKSNNDNKRILAEQISKITDAARQLQLENQKDLAKS